MDSAYEKLRNLLDEYENSNADADTAMSDSMNWNTGCSYCMASCFGTNCRGNCHSAIAPRIRR